MLKGQSVFFGSDENVLKLEVLATHHCKCTKCHWPVYFQVVNFMYIHFTPVFKNITIIAVRV